ncbi:MAG: hypothetical protein GXO99_07700 [Nitrospirae bacterium]|nr:hypothetical protein [Nitrospirota bacterium]
MKTSWSNRLSYLGAGISIALFIIFGFMPGTLVSGLIGLKILSLIFGMPVEPSVFSRLFLAVCIFFGVFITALVFVVAGTTVGWLLGLAIDSLKREKKEAAEEKGSVRV